MPPGFESYAEALRRRQQRIRVLRQGDTRERLLAHKLQGCSKGERCQSEADPICTVRLHDAAIPIFRGRPHWTRVSVVPARVRVPYGELATIDLRALVKRTRKRLERSSLHDRTIIGGIDISLNLRNNTDPHWQPHLY